MRNRSYKTVRYDVKERTAWIWLKRPEVHNAFNMTMIDELDEIFSVLKEADEIRIVVLTGEGKSFCAGADLNWMGEIIQYSFDQNLKETLKLADVFYKIYSLPKPTIALVNGAAIGGGTGFVAACDIVISSKKAVFGLSEVRLGLVPAAISPYVLKKIGENAARLYFLTGKRIPASRAREIGLVNEVVPLPRLIQTADEIIRDLLEAGPGAIANCKDLLFHVPRMSLEEARTYTARMIAELRISEEGQEGMSAFFQKRKPRWASIKDIKK